MALVANHHGRDALDSLIVEQEATLLARTARSHELHVAAAAHLPGGVASSWQDAPPCPVFVERGHGSRVWDVDGTEYVDLHAGFGATLAGHAHPAIVAAVSDRVAAGTHFAQPVPDIVARRRRAGPPLRAAAVAVRQLRHRGHDGRGPPHARRHRPPPHHQGRGQLPRPPRHRAGVGVPRARRRRPARPAHDRPRARRGAGRRRRPHPRRAVRSPRRRAPRAARPPGRGRRHDRRAGDDEHRRRPAPAGLPRRAARRCCTPTAPCSRSTRSRPA